MISLHSLSLSLFCLSCSFRLQLLLRLLISLLHLRRAALVLSRSLIQKQVFATALKNGFSEKSWNVSEI